MKVYGYDPLRESLDAFVNETQRYVSGKVKLKLFKGNIQVTGRESPNRYINIIYPLTALCLPLIKAKQ